MTFTERLTLIYHGSRSASIVFVHEAEFAERIISGWSEANANAGAGPPIRATYTLQVQTDGRTDGRIAQPTKPSNQEINGTTGGPKDGQTRTKDGQNKNEQTDNWDRQKKKY